MADFTTNFKPARLVHDVKKWEKRVSRQAAKKKETQRAFAAWLKLSAQVCARDRNTCRVCTCQTTKAGKGDPRLWGGAHHLVYRSAGGLDELSNLIWTCRQCHADEHAHVITVTGTSDQLAIQDHRRTA